ncbi:MAG: membrane protein insertion efficiency factor YidD [Nitrospinales bacterium]
MLKFLVIKFIKLYQLLLSPFTAPSCRFYPSCSEYAVEALGRFGLFKAFRLIVMRLLKCHPYYDGGYDPVK